MPSSPLDYTLPSDGRQASKASHWLPLAWCVPWKSWPSFHLWLKGLTPPALQARDSGLLGHAAWLLPRVWQRGGGPHMLPPISGGVGTGPRASPDVPPSAPCSSFLCLPLPPRISPWDPPERAGCWAVMRTVSVTAPAWQSGMAYMGSLCSWQPVAGPPSACFMGAAPRCVLCPWSLSVAAGRRVFWREAVARPLWEPGGQDRAWAPACRAPGCPWPHHVRSGCGSGPATPPLSRTQVGDHR